MGEAVTRSGLECRGQNPELGLGGEARAQFRRELGHRLERGGEFDIQVIPEPGDVDRVQLPAHQLQAQLLAGQVVEIDEARRGHGGI